MHWHTPKAALWGLTALALAAPLAGCDALAPNRARVRTELMRVRAPGAMSQIAAALLPAPAQSGPNWSSDFKVESFRTHITSIWLKNPNNSGGVEIYRCPAQTVEGCLVELTGPELQNLLPSSASFPLHPGTYDEIQVNFLDPAGTCTTTVYLKGSVQLGDGLTYHTKSSGDPLRPGGPSETVTYTGNGCSRQYALATPLTVSSDSTYDLAFRLYFDARHMAYALQGAAARGAWSDGGCKGPAPTTDSAPANPCQYFPEIAATISSKPPVIERYRINGSGILGLFVEGDTNQPIGAYALVDYRPGQPNTLGFRWGSPYRVERNPDGSFKITMHGSLSGNKAVLPSFRRSNHSGAYEGWDGKSHSYTAVRID